MKITRLYLLVVFLSISSAFAFANANSVFDNLNFEEAVSITISTDLDALLSNPRSLAKYPANLRYKDAHKEWQNWNVKLKIRGKFRRINCQGIPPLKVYFDKADLELAGLAGFDDYKLVNYCPADELIAKEILLKEYLSYKIYNEVTDASFRVQLLKITYKDNKSNRKLHQMGFLIEDAAELRSRIAAKKYNLADENGGAVPFELKQMQLMSVFQYMIGNTDWDWRMGRNLKFVGKHGKVLPIPYDFDFAGLVNAPYATPNTDFGLTSLTERAFIAREEDLVNIQPILQQYKAKKTAIYGVIKGSRVINSSVKQSMLYYLDSFYADLSAEKIFKAVPNSEELAAK